MKFRIIYCGVIVLLLSFNVCVVSAFNAAGVDIHGFLSQGYLKSDDNNYLANTEDGSAEFTELGINFSKEFDKLRIGLQLLSRDLGDFGNNEVELDWAVGDYRFNEKVGLRVGKVKTPVGLYNQERDLDMLRIPVLLPASVYDEGARDINNTYQGIGFYGFFDLQVAGELEYELFYGGLNVDENSVYVRGIKTLIENGIPGSTLSDFTISPEYVAGAALRWNTPFEGLRIGGTYRTAEADVSAAVNSEFIPGGQAFYNADVTKNAVWVASTEYTWNDLVLTAEYSENKIDTLAGVIGMGPPDKGTLHSSGWYAQASWRFNEWFAASLYYSEYYPDKDDKDGDEEVADGNPDYYGWQKEIVPSLRFDIGYNFIIKAETHFINGAAQVYDFNNPSGREKDWILYILKASFNF